MATSKAFGLVRQFSSSASCHALAKAPIQLFGLEGRYAHALFSAATKKNCVDQVNKDMQNMRGFLEKDTRFAGFVKDPTVQRKAKRDALTETLKKQKFSDVTVNYFAALAENGRLTRPQGFLEAFEKIMAAVRGEVLCVVTTAKPLDAKQRKDLEGSLNQFLKKGETMQITMNVDPSLIGGMTVSIGDRFADMSIASKLSAYERALKTAL